MEPMNGLLLMLLGANLGLVCWNAMLLRAHARLNEHFQEILAANQETFARIEVGIMASTAAINELRAISGEHEN